VTWKRSGFLLYFVQTPKPICLWVLPLATDSSAVDGAKQTAQ